MATRAKYIVVRQDTLEGMQADGTWGERMTAREFGRKSLAMDAAAVAGDQIGRMVTVHVSIQTILARSAE